MYLENLVIDAIEPQRLGRFWEAVVGAERLTDEPGIYETHLEVAGGPWLDLCFQGVAKEPADPATEPRLSVLVSGAGGPAEEVDRLLGLGARRLDADRGPALADPEGNPFLVARHSASYDGSGPLAALSLASADPERDAAFWSWLTGWTGAAGAAGVAGDAGRTLRHPSLRGPLLELRPESGPKGPAKNRMHLDVRLEAGEDADDVEAAIAERGGARLVVDWGDLPWRSYTDPSGNEFCVLPASSS